MKHFRGSPSFTLCCTQFTVFVYLVVFSQYSWAFTFTSLQNVNTAVTSNPKSGSSSKISPLTYSQPLHHKKLIFSSTLIRRYSYDKEKGEDGIVEEDLALTPKLAKMAGILRTLDDNSRFQQIFALAKKLKPLKDQFKISENKVPGCLSTVHVIARVEVEKDEGSNEEKKRIYYEGDSDGQLTKGLVAFLIEGLSGCTNEEIQALNPEFIKYTGLGYSLTPGRNNGFMNMLAVMKAKANEINRKTIEQIKEEAANGAKESESIDFKEIEGKPMYNSIMKRLLNTLKPTKLELKDVSSQHAGHAGREGFDRNSESHFELYVESDAFEPLNTLKRHKLIYALLAEQMEEIHALQITARTSLEAQK